MLIIGSGRYDVKGALCKLVGQFELVLKVHGFSCAGTAAQSLQWLCDAVILKGRALDGARVQGIAMAVPDYRWGAGSSFPWQS